ncbi:hypothetical protein [Erwinia sp.]|uniref:hypothetical protein n=1 Tax=Erwinia citreus TaxID=558 RepID=UPI003C781045
MNFLQPPANSQHHHLKRRFISSAKADVKIAFSAPQQGVANNGDFLHHIFTPALASAAVSYRSGKYLDFPKNFSKVCVASKICYLVIGKTCNTLRFGTKLIETFQRCLFSLLPTASAFFLKLAETIQIQQRGELCSS